MWYALQITVFCLVIYPYLTEIKHGQPIGFVILLGALAAFLATLLVNAALNAVRKLITALRSLRLTTTEVLPLSGGSQKPKQRPTVHRSRILTR